MANRRRGSYPYSTERPFSQPAIRRPPVKKKKRRRFPLVMMVLLLILVGSTLTLVFSEAARHAVISVMPFPKKLVALRLQLNGKEVILMPGSQCVLNPRDSIQLLEVQTDGWVSWGTRVTAPELDAARMRKEPVAFKDLMPQESFETPKTIEFKPHRGVAPLGRYPSWSSWMPKTGCKKPMPQLT